MININVNAKNVWNPDACNCEKGKCLAGIVDDSAFTCDEAVESYYEKAKTSKCDFFLIGTNAKRGKYFGEK